MKKILSYIAFTAIIFSVGVSQIFAAPPPIYQPIMQVDCDILGVCAVYVDDKANPNPSPHAGTKTDWFVTITDAVNKVKTDSDYNTIIIAEGDYSLNGTPESMPFEFDELDSWKTDRVNIYGGYAEGFNERDPELYPTVIDGNDGVANAIKVDNLGGNVSGIEFTNFNGSGTAPVYITNKGATSYSFNVENNKFYGNTLGLGSYSAILDLSGSNSGKFAGNEVTDNSGGGLNSYVSLIGDVDAYNNVFTYNNAWTGIGCTGATVYNNYLISNDYNTGLNAYGDCKFYNNTVVGNDVNSGTSNASIYMSGNSNIIANNLIAYNAGNQSFYHSGGDTSTFEYNALYSNGSDPSEGSLTDGNVLCDPMFAGATYNDPDTVKYGEGSECIDSGKTVSAVTDDYYGTARPLDGDGTGGADYDPGAYEAPEYTAPSPGDAPEITGLSVSPSEFSPDNDGDDDTTTISFNISDNADVTVMILNESDVELKKIIDNVAKSAGSILTTWDGENDLNQVVEDGTYKVRVEISNTDGDHSSEVNVYVNTSGQPMPGSECGGYSDVSGSDPACDAIEYMQSIGAMTGNPDGTFAPDENLQRDQVAKIVLETFGLFDDTEDYCNGVDPFPDVPSSQWSYQYICRGVELGMITGYEGGEDAGFYRPARAVNRVEFLALTLRNLSEDMPALSSISYNDVEINQWYSGYAKYSFDKGLFTGDNLYPAQSTKRVEVAEVIYELYNQGKI